MRKLLLAGAALALLGGGLGAGILASYERPGPLSRAVNVVVPRGSFTAGAEVLRRAGVVRSVWALRGFEAATRWQGPVRAAEMSFPAGASIERVLLVLRFGRPVQHLLTVPEGLTSARVAGLLAEVPGLVGWVAVPEEGSFLPESYAYERGFDGAAVIQRARLAMQAVVERAWRGRAAGLPLRSEQELVVLASLVERETHLAAERALVAAVFVNRLRLGMRLQADSSVEYAAGGGSGTLGHGLRHEELDTPTPYNTYMIAGLPAGAICNPGEAAIMAAAHPAASEALYFVADGTGGHVFARGLEEHRGNVVRYRAVRR